jgi:DEAD/DEAH box helicase domain-containing protein
MNTVFFDVETQRIFDEVGGRENVKALGLAAAVTYSTATEAFRHYTEENVDALLAELNSAGLVVGFNVLRFDYEVLRPYGPLNPARTVDMLEQIYLRLGFRVSLGSLADATLGICKSADGLQAVRWYKEGRIQEILDYCQQDVDITRRLYEYGQQNKHLKYKDRNFRIQIVPVNW